MLLLCKQRSEVPSSTAENALFQLIYLDGRDERATYIWNGVGISDMLVVKTLLVDIRDPEMLFCIDGLTQNGLKTRRNCEWSTFWGFSVFECTSFFGKQERQSVTLCLLPFWSESDL